MSEVFCLGRRDEAEMWQVSSNILKVIVLENELSRIIVPCGSDFVLGWEGFFFFPPAKSFWNHTWAPPIDLHFLPEVFPVKSQESITRGLMNHCYRGHSKEQQTEMSSADFNTV